MSVPLASSLAADATLPRAELCDLPTPVERFETLGERLGIDALWVKRDDRTSALYGGNKVRKLEFLLGDARRRGLEDVWTIGSLGSNHVLATSLFARELSRPTPSTTPSRSTRQSARRCGRSARLARIWTCTTASWPGSTRG